MSLLAEQAKLISSGFYLFLIYFQTRSWTIFCLMNKFKVYFGSETMLDHILRKKGESVKNQILENKTRFEKIL